MRGLIVCATPRSGSNYLCQLLASTGVLGVPREYFNPVGRRAYDDPDYPDDPRAQLAQVVTTGATPNGVYAVKAHPFQLRELDGVVDPLAELPDALLVRLRRLGRLEQAVSWARVQQTSQYRAGDPAVAEPAYDAELVATALRFVEAEEAWWDARLDPDRVLAVTYEDLVADPQHVVDRVAARVGLDEPAVIDPAEVTVRVQRDETSRRWFERYASEGG